MNHAREYDNTAKKDPFSCMTENIQDASTEETAEILSEIEILSEKDLAISSSRLFTVS